MLESYGRVLMATPGLAQLALSTIAAGPNSLRVIEALLEALEEGGLDSGTAAWAVDLFLLYVTAISAEQGQRDPASSPTGQHHSRAFGSVVPRLSPCVCRARRTTQRRGATVRVGARHAHYRGLQQSAPHRQE